MNDIEYLKRITLGCCFLVAAVAIVASGSPRNEHAKKYQSRQTTEQKCDLICPGHPVYPLPLNFIQNCTSNNSTLSKPPVVVTTLKPSTTTEDNEESIENNSTTIQNETAKAGKQIHNRHIQKKNIGLKIQMKEKTHEHKRHALRKQTLMLKKGIKSRLFSHHIGLKERTRLDGCYVICEEPSATGPEVEVEGGSELEGSDEDSDGDNYAEGEDEPLEIIYVPSQREEGRRPYDIYQQNFQELPQFPLASQFEGESGPELWEDKSKRIKKRKQHMAAKSKQGDLPLNHHA
ncbi:uncharacterized protein [Euwallacea fornicatus]|uniref:uncharacterized protein n=1 Tax=Euwallacea fornicatus TaxID=995702 RepID=UPI0033902344